MEVNEFVLESMIKIRKELVTNDKGWKVISKPASELTESEIFELQSSLVNLQANYGRLLEFMQTWKLFSEND